MADTPTFPNAYAQQAFNAAQQFRAQGLQQVQDSLTGQGSTSVPSTTTDPMTNPGTGSSSSGPSFQFVFAESGSSSIGSVVGNFGGQSSNLFTLGASGPVTSDASSPFPSVPAFAVDYIRSAIATSSASA